MSRSQNTNATTDSYCYCHNYDYYASIKRYYSTSHDQVSIDNAEQLRMKDFPKLSLNRRTVRLRGKAHTRSLHVTR